MDFWLARLVFPPRPEVIFVPYQQQLTPTPTLRPKFHLFTRRIERNLGPCLVFSATATARLRRALLKKRSFTPKMKTRMRIRTKMRMRTRTRNNRRVKTLLMKS